MEVEVEKMSSQKSDALRERNRMIETETLNRTNIVELILELFSSISFQMLCFLYLIFFFKFASVKLLW